MAKKVFRIHEAPQILVVQLKRYDHNGKIDQSVPYPELLHLRPYMTEREVRISIM